MQENPTNPTGATPSEPLRFLVQTCREVLKLEEVKPDDDFFAIGGDSLLALQVYERVRIHYRQEIPLFDLSIEPTIERLALVVERTLAGQAKEKYRCLKCVQKGDTSVTPLFLVHGGDGNARIFQRLTRHLDPRIPVYAFRWSGWDGCRGDTTLQAMATRYYKELSSFHPEGPVRIGGYCIGGAVALRMAELLGAEGREVEGPVLIWDAPNFGAASYRRREPWYSPSDYLLFRNLVSEMEQNKRALLGDCEPLVTPTQFTGSYEMLRRFPRLFILARTVQIRIGTLFPIRLRLLLNKPVRVKWRWIYCMTTMFFAIREPFEIGYSGPVVYFRSDVFLGRPMNTLGWWADLYMGFREFCRGDFKGYVVGGDHVNVLGQPAGGRMVNELYFGRTA